MNSLNLFPHTTKAMNLSCSAVEFND